MGLTSQQPFGRRLLVAASDTRILWAVAVVFGARDLFFWLLPNPRDDTQSFMAAGALYLRNPVHLYDATRQWLLQTGTIPVPGAQGLALQPPSVIALASPFSLLPRAVGVATWAAADALALLGALLVLERALRPHGPARPLFWVAAAYFPPLFAEVDAGQVGGFVLLLAVAAIALARTRPILAGVLGGGAAALKLYPGAMLLGVGPRGRRFAPALLVSGAALLLAAFLPLGLPGGPLHYLTGVLIPSEHARLQDCAIVSVPTLFARTVGGDPFPYIGPGGALQTVRSPLHLPSVATALTALAVLAGVVAAAWAAWRSGWHALYGPCLGLALGGLLPSEIYPYQVLPVLPLTLVVGVRALQTGTVSALLGLTAGLLLFIKQPCAVPVPNLWTLGAIVLFVTSVTQHGLFRAAEASDG